MKTKEYFDTKRNGDNGHVFTTKSKIVKFSDEVRDLLIFKNSRYGDSATKPLNIFARGKARENISCRIDDKLARIKNVGIHEGTTDTIKDLIGYLILLLIAIDEEEEMTYK
jgi:hypothetical protein